MQDDINADQVFVALGVLSSADSFETGRASASRSRLIRNRVRWAASLTNYQQHVALRFVLAQRNGRRSLPPPPPVFTEASKYSDMVFVNMTERFYLCAWKKILWFQYARTAFPLAGWFAIADPDTFISLSHLSDDLRSVTALIAQGKATNHVLWGLIMWKAYYNQVSEEPAHEFSGWLPKDKRAVHMRRRLEHCRDLLLNRTDAPPRPEWLMPGIGPDAGYDAWAKEVLSTKHECRGFERASRRALARMLPEPPYPFANGPLFAVTRPLGELLISDTAVVPAWRQRIEATAPVRLYFIKGGVVPHTLRGSSCYPASFDATFGRWVTEIASAHALHVTLVNTPFMIQHHPWLSFHHGAFSNASIVLHELKDPTSPGWQFAASRGIGNFVPLVRTCGSCQELGWSSVQGSMHGQWKCCGQA
mmetsp:Transcript_73319/g.122447  ORF Transcript_73319/g.122447 Transcript_73319/m.122447 type:complete len:419 (+) Transcript_73319:23-1279(+)